MCRLVFNLGILARVVLDVIEDCLCGSLRLHRRAWSRPRPRAKRREPPPLAFR